MRLTTTPDAKITYELGPDPTKGRFCYGITAYHWEGGEVARLSRRDVYRIMFECSDDTPTLNRGDTFVYGPFILRVIDNKWGELLVSQDGWKSKLHCQVYPIIKWFNLIHYRLLQTAYVWNLIDVELGCVIAWSDLRLIKKSRLLWGKMKLWTRI